MLPHIDKHWIDSDRQSTRSRRLSPPAFRYQLTELARQANKRVVLPEGERAARTIKAAAICAERGIARPVLLGNREIRRVAEQRGVVLTDRVGSSIPLPCASAMWLVWSSCARTRA